MTPQELSDDLRAASLAEFGDTGAEMFPAKYFNSKVQSIDPKDGRQPRMPKYCATNEGAALLKAIFSADNRDASGYVCAGIALGNAMLFTGLHGSFVDSEPVPYLAFGPIKVDPETGAESLTGPFVNAGTLLDYLNHGYAINKSWADVINEVQKAT